MIDIFNARGHIPKALLSGGACLLASAFVAACDVTAPDVSPTPSAELSSPAAVPLVLPSPSPVRPPQSPPAGAPAPD